MLHRFNKTYILQIQSICSRYDLTPVQWLVLRHISEHKGCTSIEIVREWSVEKPTVSSLVRKLESMEYLTFSEGKDKRQKFLYLTENGEAVCKRVTSKVNALQAYVMADESQETLDQLLEKIVLWEERLKTYEGTNLD